MILVLLSLLLLLADRKNSPVPPSQTLGVLFFPLSPPSRKGATHNQRGTSSSARLQGWATTHICWGFPTPTKKSVSLYSLSITIPISAKKVPFFPPPPFLYPDSNPNSCFYLGFPPPFFSFDFLIFFFLVYLVYIFHFYFSFSKIQGYVRSFLNSFYFHMLNFICL